MSFDRTLPPLLAALHALPFDYGGDGEGIDFEPYDQFQSAEENTSWIKAWTGNQDLTAQEFRIFGQDGTGGYAALWLVRPGAELLLQPIVFFGSEGELGIVAADFFDYLWLLAAHAGPYEAVAYGADGKRERNATFEAFAAKHAAAARKSGSEVIARAKIEFPDFEKNFRALVQY